MRKMLGILISPVLKATGFRFSKDYRRAERGWMAIVYRHIDTVGANIRAGYGRPIALEHVQTSARSMEASQNGNRMPEITENELLELEALRAAQAKRREIGQQRGKANAKLRPCPQCADPANARQRRKGCACGYRWPVRDR